MTISKISQQKINCIIIVNILLILFGLYFLGHSNLDIFLQKFLFNFDDRTWIIDRDEPIKKFIFHKFPKMLLGIFIATTLYAMILGFRNKSVLCHKYRHQIAITLLGISLIPLIAGNIKKFTNVYCPYQLEIYNGTYPYVKIFESYPQDFIQSKRGKCFPAGHVVTGFALFILFFSLQQKKHKIIALGSAIIIGWILGFYQMAKGAHFFSDTLIAMLLCFLLAALITRIYQSFLAKESL